MPSDLRTPLQGASLEQVPLRAYEKLRYVDTDRQGHVNDEARRSEALPEPARRVLESLR